MRKWIDDMLNKLGTRQISWITLIVAYVIILSIVAAVSISETKYELWQFKYAQQSDTLGYLDSGSEGVFSYGPYVDIASGNWKVSIDYEADKDTRFDVVYHAADGTINYIDVQDMYSDKNHAELVFNLEHKVDNESLEIRTYYPGEGRFQLNKVKIKRCMVFKWYGLITLITAVAAIMIFKGKSFFKMIDEPKQVMYCALFYLIVISIYLFSALYLPDQDGEGLNIIINVCIVFHAYGLKREVYRHFTRRNVSTVLGCVYTIGSFYVLDLMMRYETSAETEMTFASYEPNLFTFAFIGVVVVIMSLIPKKWIKRLIYGIVYFTFLALYAVQRVYYQVFNKLFSFKDMALAKEGSDYTDYVVKLLSKQFIQTMVIMIIVGIIGILLIRETLKMQKEWYLVVGSVIASILLYNHTLYGGDYGEWNSFDNENYIYATMTNRVGAFKLCGFYQYELRDLQLSIFGNGIKQKEQIKDVDEYYEAKEETETTNDLTGILKGKNVIFCLMESIDDIALNDSVMPTLYQMSQKGIYFDNMYASIYGSAATLNSEMVTNVGLYAPLDGTLVYSFSDNYFPYSMANLFTNQGYAARQYHFNTPSFYNREYTNKAFGYKEYVCYQDYVDDGYMQDDIIATNHDLFSTLIQDDKFFDYIITYSAHLSYDSSDSVVQYALQNHPEYASMTSSEEVNNYLAKCRVTDDMLAGLIADLRNQSLLKDTVIIAVGDHYPYGISDVDTLYELSGVERYTQLLYKVPCVIWSPDMEEMGISQQVDKVASSIDILPTIVNLFDLGDTSVYLGHDIFDSNYEGMAYFADGSWLTKDAYYYNGNIVSGEMSDEDVRKMNDKVMNQINANDNILKSDYFRHKE